MAPNGVKRCSGRLFRSQMSFTTPAGQRAPPVGFPQGDLRGPDRGPGPDPGRWSDGEISEKIDFFNMS